MTSIIPKSGLIAFFAGASLWLQAASPIVGSWDFDSDARLYQSPVSGLTLRGDAKADRGIVGGGIRFDGRKDYLEVVLPEENRPREEMTLSFWYRPDADSVLYPAIRHRNTTFAANGSAGFSWYELNTENGGHYYNGYAHPERLKPDTWYHFAMVYSQKGLSVYLDGRKISSAPVDKGGVIRNTVQPLMIGGRLYGTPGNYSGFFKGRMDEIVILKEARTDFSREQALKLREQLRKLDRALPQSADWRNAFAGFDKRCEQSRFGQDGAALLAEAEQLKRDGLRQYRRQSMQREFGDAASSVGFAVTTASPLRRVLPGEFKFDPATARIALDLAANEKEAVQLILHPEKSETEVKVELPKSLSAADGGQVAFPMQLYRVGYTRLTKPSPYMYELPQIPDKLLPGTEFKLPAEPVTPLWLEVAAPAGTPPGLYRGDIVLRSASGAISLPLELRVRHFELPQRNLAPSLVNIWERDIQTYVEPGDAEGFVDRLEAYALMLADHRLNPVVLAHGGLVAPWLRDAVYPNYRAVDGKAQINWRYFDRIVGKLRAKGVSRIAIGPHYNFDQTKLGGGDWLTNIRNTDPRPIWQAIQEHARAQGYLDDAVAYPLDEPENNVALVNAITSLVKQGAPQLPFLLTSGGANYPDTSLQGVDVWVPIIHWTNFMEKARQQRQGVPVWTYVCTGPNYPLPNLHSDTPPMGIRMVPVGAMRFEYDGFLHWAANFATYKNVPENFVNSFAAGEGTYIYADANGYPIPSIRLKSMADGMEDWNALLLLKARDPQRYRQLHDKLAELIPERSYDKTMPMTLKNPKEGSFHTFLDKNAFYPVYDTPERYLAWRTELYNTLDQLERKGQK